MASLRELQQAFAAALRDPATGVDVSPTANLDVYRNNSDWQFRNALAVSFPVLKRRVGDDYFRQLTFRFRQRFPSRSGDLLWVGRDFPGFLADHLRGGDYAWLADLARLEWAREVALVADALPALGPEALGKIASERLGEIVFRLQPSLQLLSSRFPVWSVWMANQQENASPVDQSAGEESVMILPRDDGAKVARVSAPLFAYFSALAEGRPLAESVAIAGLDEAGLLEALRFSFAEGIVVGVELPVQSANR